MKPTSIRQAFEKVAAQHAHKIALKSTDGRCLTYDQLWKIVSQFGETLDSNSIAKGDVIIVCLMDSFDNFIALLSAMCHGVALPMPSVEHDEEFCRLADTINIGAMVSEDSNLDRGNRLAKSGVSNFHFTGNAHVLQKIVQAENFDLERKSKNYDERVQPIEQDCLFIRTGGTLSAPKMIAISDESLLASTLAMIDWAKINRNDTSLSMMPHHHMHSIHRTILPVLFAGGTVVVTPGPNAREMAGWLQTYAPTIVTGTPTILLALSDAVKKLGISENSIRFVANGSDALNSAQKTHIERTLGTFVSQFYGLSETAPFLTTTTETSRPESIGQITLPWEYCFAENSKPSSDLEEGEIAVRNGVFNDVIIDGVRKSLEFTEDGWFLTGDLGRRLPDGEIEFLGRVADTINKAGVKIEPALVESCLTEIPAVQDCVCFGHFVSETSTTESIALVIGLAPAQLQDVREELQKKLPFYALPDKILVVEEIPRQANTKISRKMLSTMLQKGELKLVTQIAQTPDLNSIESGHPENVNPKLRAIFSNLLETGKIDSNLSFFEVGGDSFLALQLILEIEENFGKRLSPSDLTSNSSLLGLTKFLLGGSAESMNDNPDLVCISDVGDNPPLFMAPLRPLTPLYSAALIEAFAEHRQPVYSFDLAHDDAELSQIEKFSDIVDRCVNAILQHQPAGPYALCGHSFGAHVALEMANRLIALGHKISVLMIIDDQADLHKRLLGASHEYNFKGGSAYLVRIMKSFYQNSLQSYYGKIFLVRSEFWKGDYKSTPAMEWEYIASSGVETLNLQTTHSWSIEGEHAGPWIRWVAAQLSNDQEVLKTIETHSTPPADHSLAEAAARARAFENHSQYSSELQTLKAAVRDLDRPPTWLIGRLIIALSLSGKFETAIALIVKTIEECDDPVYLTILYCRLKKALENSDKHRKFWHFRYLKVPILRMSLKAKMQRMLRKNSVESTSENLQLHTLAQVFGDQKNALKFANAAFSKKSIPMTSLPLVVSLIADNKIPEALELAQTMHSNYPNQKHAKQGLRLARQAVSKQDVVKRSGK